MKKSAVIHIHCQMDNIVFIIGLIRFIQLITKV
jgi:hypothetical protein